MVCKIQMVTLNEVISMLSDTKIHEFQATFDHISVKMVRFYSVKRNWKLQCPLSNEGTRRSYWGI